MSDPRQNPAKTGEYSPNYAEGKKLLLNFYHNNYNFAVTKNVK